MARTTTDKVKTVLGANYGKLPDGSEPDLQQYIDTATVIVTRAAADAALPPKSVVLSSVELELVERWLAAHFYCRMDPLYTTRSTGGASGGFQRGPSTEGFASTDYGRTACELDYSGALTAIGKRQLAQCFWIGKVPSAQTDYCERD